MATALAAVSPLSGALQRATLTKDSFAATRRFTSSTTIATAAVNASVHVLEPRNRGLNRSDRTCNGCGSQGTRKRGVVARCSGSAEKKGAYAVREVADEDLEREVEPEDVTVLAAIRSSCNYITVMEISSASPHVLAGARLLLLDNPGCIHTVYYPSNNALTNSYYDTLSSLVPLIPAGPLGILGLGAGATSHVLHHFFPSVEMHGWELDPEIIRTARQFFDMAELEAGPGADDGPSLSPNSKKSSFVDHPIAVEPVKRPGPLRVHVGDALGVDVAVEGGFAGLIVDLFAEGRVIPSLQERGTWEQLKAKLRPGGRIIVNCGGERVTPGQQSKSSGQLYMEQTIAAMKEVFPGELCSRYLARKGFNTVAITGPPPDLESWAQALPEPLRDGISDWKPVL